MHKFKLDFEDEYEFLLFGVSCHLKDYRVAWYLNQKLRLDLVRSTLNIRTSKDRFHDFGVYKAKDEANRLNYLLLDNYSEDYPLLKSHKQYDFFILIEGYIDLFDVDDFKSRLREIESFQMVSELETDLLKKHQYTLFEA